MSYTGPLQAVDYDRRNVKKKIDRNIRRCTIMMFTKTSKGSLRKIIQTTYTHIIEQSAIKPIIPEVVYSIDLSKYKNYQKIINDITKVFKASPDSGIAQHTNIMDPKGRFQLVIRIQNPMIEPLIRRCFGLMKIIKDINPTALLITSNDPVLAHWS